jgi:hypothetical protein
MNKKKLVITIGLVFVFAMVAMVTNQQISNAQECKIIRIDEVKGTPEKTIRLDTEKLIVAKGTCVVWINWSGQLVKVVFKEAAQKCSVAMDGQSGFKFVDNCFVSNMVPNAGTSSVRFNVAGNYRYEIVIPPAEPSPTAKDKVMAAGEIIVE